MIDLGPLNMALLFQKLSAADESESVSMWERANLYMVKIEFAVLLFCMEEGVQFT